MLVFLNTGFFFKLCMCHNILVLTHSLGQAINPLLFLPPPSLWLPDGPQGNLKLSFLASFVLQIFYPSSWRLSSFSPTSQCRHILNYNKVLFLLLLSTSLPSLNGDTVFKACIHDTIKFNNKNNVCWIIDLHGGMP